MTRVVLHVGAHKTGTSLVQKFMRDNPLPLRSRRVFYVARGEMDDLVGWGGRLRDDPSKLRRRVKRVAYNPWYRLVVASHENSLGRPLEPGRPGLYPRAEENASLLAEVLAPWQTEILFYLRPQEEFLESYYLQLIHQGAHLTFGEWLDGVDLESVSWQPVVDALAAAFGRENVEIVDFHLIRQGQNFFVEDFLRRVDPALDLTVEYDPLRNPSIGDKGLHMALAANRHVKGGEERKAMRKFLQKHFSNRKYPRPVLFSEEQKATLHRLYGVEYDELVGSARRAA